MFYRKLSVVLALCCFLPDADAQTLALTDPIAFKESWLTAPQASRGVTVGANIVGLRVDSAPKPFDPGAVRVMLGDIPGDHDTLCVAVLSQDGRYSAQLSYRIPPHARGPALLQSRTAYATQLAGFKDADMAILARSGKTCNDTKTAVSYVVVPSGAQPKQLVVQLEAGDARVRAQLGQANHAVSDPAVCAQATTAVRVTFTHECRVNLPAQFKPGLFQLIIGETASTGEVVAHAYPIALSPLESAAAQ